MQNVLLLNGLDFHLNFFENVIKCDENGLNDLKDEIIDYYRNDIPDFYFKDFNHEIFEFKNYKGSGSFKELYFNFKGDQNRKNSK